MSVKYKNAAEKFSSVFVKAGETYFLLVTFYFLSTFYFLLSS